MRTLSVSAIQAVPNVTPMIDVMLVLLVIFMVTTPALLDGMQALPPSAKHAINHPAENEDQVLGIDGAGSFFLNKRPIRKEQLATDLRAIYSKRTIDKVLYMRADRSTEYRLVLDALDVAARNGVVVVGMISEQRNASEPARRQPR